MSKPPQKPKKIYWIAFAILILIIGTMLVLWAIAPRPLSDGVANFQGEERQAARTVLDELNQRSSQGIESVGNVFVLKRQAVRVTKEGIPTKGMYSSCKSLYNVSIVEVSLFGARRELGEKSVCLR